MVKNAGNARKISVSISIHFFFLFSTMGHYRGDSLTHPMLITALSHFQPDDNGESRSVVGSLSLAKHLVEFELESFRF